MNKLSIFILLLVTPLSISVAAQHDLVGALAALPEQGFGPPGHSVSFDGLEGRATRAGTGDLNLVKTAVELVAGAKKS
jgi:hypothetical protein